MRLPYVPNPPDFKDEQSNEILERVKARRGEKGLIPLDLALLHAPQVADGWNTHLGAIRTRTSLRANIREIAILRPALINGAWFEWMHHVPLFESSPSYVPEKLETVQALHPTAQGALTDAEWVVLRYADAMTRDVTVPQEIFNELRSHGGFNEQEIVEITATVATYNMVSRFLVALDVGEKNDDEPDFVKQNKSKDRTGLNKTA